MRRLSLAIVMLIAVALPATSAPTTEEFANRLMICAGGIEVAIDARLLGSVRTIYEGDRTEGKARMRTEAAFLSKLPPEQRLAAMELYHRCIKDIVQTSYVIDRELLDFRIWLDVPIDLVIEMQRDRVEKQNLLKQGSFFEYFLKQMNIDYKLTTTPCSWRDLPSFNADNSYYFRRGHTGELHPDNISVSKSLTGQFFAGTKFAFNGRAWDGNKANFQQIPSDANPVRSIENLVGKCMYIRISGALPFNFRYIPNDQVRGWVEKYHNATFKTLELSHFTLQLSDTFAIKVLIGNTTKVFHGEGLAIWQIKLPDKIDGFRMRQ